MKNNNLSKNATHNLQAPPPSFVKLAMRNMVRKGSQSIVHFAFTGFGFLGFILLLAWFARPHLPP